VNINDCKNVRCVISCFEAARAKTRIGLKQPGGVLEKFFNQSANKISFHEKNMAE